MAKSGKQSGPPGKPPGNSSGKPPSKPPGKPPSKSPSKPPGKPQGNPSPKPSSNPSPNQWLKSRVKSAQAMPAPLRTLILIATIATSIGLWAGMMLRWTQPNLLSTVSLFQGVQSFPDADWPGSEVPQPTADLPAPEVESTTPPFIGSPEDAPLSDRLPEVGAEPIMDPDFGSEPEQVPALEPAEAGPEQAAPEPAEPEYIPEAAPEPAPEVAPEPPPPIEEAPPPPPEVPLEEPAPEVVNP